MPGFYGGDDKNVILEFQDITGSEKSFGHLPLPKGISLGQIFDADESLRKVAKCVVQASLNGTRIDSWRDLQPEKNDRVRIVLSPLDPISAFLGAVAFGGAFGATVTYGLVLSALVTVISVGQFVSGLFMTPKPPKLNIGGVADSPPYSFEGIDRKS